MSGLSDVVQRPNREFSRNRAVYNFSQAPFELIEQMVKRRLGALHSPRGAPHALTTEREIDGAFIKSWNEYSTFFFFWQFTDDRRYWLWPSVLQQAAEKQFPPTHQFQEYRPSNDDMLRTSKLVSSLGDEIIGRYYEYEFVPDDYTHSTRPWTNFPQARKTNVAIYDSQKIADRLNMQTSSRLQLVALTPRDEIYSGPQIALRHGTQKILEREILLAGTQPLPPWSDVL